MEEINGHTNVIKWAEDFYKKIWMRRHEGCQKGCNLMSADNRSVSQKGNTLLILGSLMKESPTPLKLPFEFMKNNDANSKMGPLQIFAMYCSRPPTEKIFDRWLLFLVQTFDLRVAIPYLMTLFFRGLKRCSTGPMTQYWLPAAFSVQCNFARVLLILALRYNKMTKQSKKLCLISKIF